MTIKRLKRPRDPLQLAKLIGDIATGQVEDREPTAHRPAAVSKAGARSFPMFHRALRLRLQSGPL